ncbi:hypothetical protein Q5P01_012544 [Channa striata]|uniref:Protein FAM180A n=1 Tax=Channa striata TaxID=64152 RepID=A0AA88MS15_CHASR|nr:hypothetical protein Q5P01_012544 [Channa striata]
MHKTVREGVKVLFWVCFIQVLQDVAAGTSSTSSLIGSSVSDTNLMFEFLLEGVELDLDDNIVLIDKELASTRLGRTFLSQINENIPRSLNHMAQMVSELTVQRRKPLSQSKFETLVLGMVYSAHRAGHLERNEGQEAWGEILLQLVNVTVYELRGNYLVSYD